MAVRAVQPARPRVIGDAAWSLRIRDYCEEYQVELDDLSSVTLRLLARACRSSGGREAFKSTWSDGKMMEALVASVLEEVDCGAACVMEAFKEVRAEMLKREWLIIL